VLRTVFDHMSCSMDVNWLTFMLLLVMESALRPLHTRN
jgi:hypothetical protein